MHVPYRGDEMRRSPSPRSMMAGAGLPSDHGLVQSLNGEREKVRLVAFGAYAGDPYGDLADRSFPTVDMAR